MENWPIYLKKLTLDHMGVITFLVGKSFVTNISVTNISVHIIWHMAYGSNYIFGGKYLCDKYFPDRYFRPYHMAYGIWHMWVITFLVGNIFVTNISVTNISVHIIWHIAYGSNYIFGDKYFCDKYFRPYHMAYGSNHIFGGRDVW